MKGFGKYVIAITVVALLQVWGEHSKVAEAFFEKIVEPFFDKVSLPIVYTVILLLAVRQYFGNRVNDLEAQKKNEMELLIQSHRQLAAYRRSDLFRSFATAFVDRENAVQAVQLYKYTLKKKAGLVEIKVEYVDGNVHEGIGLNAMVQNYFYLHKGMYKEFCLAKGAFDKYDRVTELLDFIRKYRSDFIDLLPEDVTEEHSTQFAMVQLAVDIVEEWFIEHYYSVPNVGLNNLDPRTSIRLNEVKRTGILRTILLQNSYYRFFHNGPGEKNGRLYLSRYVFLWDVHHVFMITLDPDVLEEDSSQEILTELQERFILGLQNSLSLVYTRVNTSNGGDRHEEAN